MNHRHSRRQWIRNGILAASALPFTPIASFAQKNIVVFAHTEVIELNANENPYGPSEKARLAIIDSLHRGNRYPMEWRAELKAAIAVKEGVEPENVLLGAGSSEILGIIALRYGRAGGNIVAADRTFPILMQNAEQLGTTWKKVPLDTAHRHDMRAMEKAVDSDTRLLYFCNPNNPTGTVVKKEELVDFCKKMTSRVPVLVDEAYIEYTIGGTQNSVATHVANNPNLMVARTFSKLYGLAGMRIGYLLAHADTIADLKKYHSSFEMSVSSAGMQAALASLNDNLFIKNSREKTNAAKTYFCQQLDKWDVAYADSTTSFVYFPVAKFYQKGHLGNALQAAKIDCRPQPKWCRMTIGTMAEMQQVVRVMEQLV